MNKKAVIFDLDGTLLNTLGDLTDSVNHILETYKFPTKSEREVRSYLGNGARELVRLALPQAVGESELDKYLEEYKAYYNAHSKIKTKPYDGVIELLLHLRERGVMTAVVSNKPDPAVGILCKEYFGELLDISLGDRADIERKPSAEPVRYVINKLKCDKAIYVGDSEVDVQTAKNADIPCVSLTWGFRDKDVLEKCGATCFANNSDELKEQIFKLLFANEV